MAEEHPTDPEQLLDTPELASALESDRFRKFLDHVPFGVAVAELNPTERIIYVNLELERIVGLEAGDLENRSWDAIPGNDGARRSLASAIGERQDYIGYFQIARGDDRAGFDAWANIIEDEEGRPLFRLVALAETGPRDADQVALLEQRIGAQDTLLRELQHRVKNNLQMITALIRLEIRNLDENAPPVVLDRLAGRIDALAALYDALSRAEPDGTVDLGVYLSTIATAVLQAHAPDGIRLDLRVDTWSVSVNVAMPTGLVVNELLTNSLKHAFVGRDGGTITLHSLIDEHGCRVVIADDGVGLPEGADWPQPGKLAALIVQSLRENARARIEVSSVPGEGVTASIYFDRNVAEPAPER